MGLFIAKMTLIAWGSSTTCLLVVALLENVESTWYSSAQYLGSLLTGFAEAGLMDQKDNNPVSMVEAMHTTSLRYLPQKVAALPCPASGTWIWAHLRLV